MKTKFRHTMRLLSMATLAMAGAIISGCSNDDLAIEAPQPDTSNTVTLTTTITLGGDGSAQTRALDAAGHKTFAAGDQMVVVYKNTSAVDNTAAATSIALKTTDITDDGKKAKITVTLENPKPDGQLYMIYPAAMASSDISQTRSIDDGLVNFNALKEQDGTLTSLAANLDLATFDGNLTSDAKLPATISLTNRLAIGEFTVNESAGSSDITSGITLLNVVNGDDRYTIRRTAAAGPIYVAMRPVSTGDISIYATDGTTDYRKTVTSPTLNANTMYPVNLTMSTDGSKALERLTSDYVAQNGDVLKGMLLNNVKISIAAKANDEDPATSVTLAGVTINGANDDSYKWAGITCLGDATITLDDGTTNNVRGFCDDYPGIFVPYGSTLTIQAGSEGTGALIASSNGGAPGIGSNKCGQEDCGDISITGGHITAYGGGDCPGIGSRAKCGHITITGGTVTATGGESGAGIGSGMIGHCKEITITGGTITAIGGDFGAGIGSGTDGFFNDITITGGTVVATGGQYGAGIGGGLNGSDNGANNITITGGTITATGGESGAGIGGGRSGFVGNITINNNAGLTSVTATRGSEDAEPIGKGKDGHLNDGATFYFFGQSVLSAYTYFNNDFYFHITNSGATWTIDKNP